MMPTKTNIVWSERASLMLEFVSIIMLLLLDNRLNIHDVHSTIGFVKTLFSAILHFNDSISRAHWWLLHTSYYHWCTGTKAISHLNCVWYQVVYSVESHWFEHSIQWKRCAFTWWMISKSGIMCYHYRNEWWYEVSIYVQVANCTHVAINSTVSYSSNKLQEQQLVFSWMYTSVVFSRL